MSRHSTVDSGSATACYVERMTDPNEQETIIPVERRGIAREFADFIIHNKLWWMTPIIIVLGIMVALILFTESSPVLPFIYTVI